MNKIVVVAVVALMLASSVGAFFLLNSNDDPLKNRYDLGEALQVFGNANGDSRIDADDIVCLEKMISGEIEITEYADANRDGKIDQKDIDQVQAIIDNTAEFVWIVDGDGYPKKISRNISRIGCEYFSNTELMLILGLKDKIYAVDYAPYEMKDFYFGANSTVKNMVNMSVPDYELLETMDLDILLTFTTSTAEKQEKLPNVDVVYLGMYRPNVADPTRSEYFQGILKAGYIFGVVERAEAYVAWLMDLRETIYGITSLIADEDKPRVLMTNYVSSYFITGNETQTWSVYTSIDPMGQSAILAGGYLVAKDILTEYQYNGGDGNMYSVSISPEYLYFQDIDYAFLHTVVYTYGAAINAGVPEHGYLTSDSSAIDLAQLNASNTYLVLSIGIDNIVIIAGDFRNGASGCMLLAAYMAKILHPDLFADFDPLDYHQQYIEWMGITDYDIRTDGVFISPALT